MTPAIAFRRDFRVIRFRNVIPLCTRSITIRQHSWAIPGFSGSTAGTPLNPIGEMPSISKAVKQMSASHELDGIGNYLAADQRGLHPFRAHGDAVSHRDRVEFYGRAARCPDALFYLECQVPVVVIAWRNLDPAMRDADYRAAQVLVGESDRLEVAP